VPTINTPQAMVGTQTLCPLYNLPHHHCEERSDDAIHVSERRYGLLRVARNDDVEP
jgi:hypothetical protein